MRFSFGKASLIFKIILANSLILVVAISFNVYWNSALHKGSIERLIQEKTTIILESVEGSVVRAMERQSHSDVQQALRHYGSFKGIWKIHIFRPDGTIMASSDEGEVNKKVENPDFYLKNRSFDREEVSRNRDGKRVREVISFHVYPIENQPKCFECHDRKTKVIGILAVGQSLQEMQHMIHAVQIHSIVLAVITVGFLAFVLGLLFLKFVQRPIKKLADVMRRAEQGDLGVRVELKGNDEMGRLAENLNGMIEKLQLAKKEADQHHQEIIQRADRMASIGELTSGIAHEIGNPLAGIEGAVQILAREFPEEDIRRQVTEEIERQIHKLEKLVKDLLNFSKPIPANYVPVNINELAEKVLSFFLTQQGRSNHFRVEKNFLQPLPNAMIDPYSMEQAFLNIILNAKKAMPDGGTFKVSSRFLSRVGKDGGEVKEVRIVFEDTGVGIPKENLSKIFNPFFSTRLDGTGLGLFITRNIIEQHGGKIDVESKVGMGTKFIITLPTIEDPSTLPLRTI
ncbi:MAG TPA: ATP-binding protein [Thermodesulfobacteriota bacterium]|nr:ATP-binding protein [Thermodesulfobacteriota bacterium]